MDYPKNIVLHLIIFATAAASISCAPAIDFDDALRSISSRRGLSPREPIDCRIADYDLVLKLILEELDREMDERELSTITVTFELFGLLPGSYPLKKKLIDMYSLFPGMYMPYQRLLVLRDNLEREQREPILCHELMHALQDQHFELGKRLDEAKSNGDLSYALRCLAEGDATVVSMGGAGWLGEFADPVGIVRKMLTVDEIGKELDLPPVLVSQMANCYTLGVGFVDAVYRKGGWGAVNGAFVKLASTEQIIHPAKLLDPRYFDEPTEIPQKLAGKDAFKGMKVIATNVHGEYLIDLILRQRIHAAIAVRAASGWDGDRFWVFETGEKKYFYLWLTVWDTKNDTVEFVEAIDAYFGKKYPAAGIAHGIGETEKTYFGRYAGGRRVLVFDNLPRPLLKEAAALKEKLLEESMKDEG
ncbi:MAG: hypothetical protein E3J72_06100 [Planctomycetota bacterium]|nr:MAG: hypothetical protein E3J72_06100 [Planctomycetota bacterium]